MEENLQFDKKSLRYVTGKTADFGELAKDCVAFANSHGGYLAIGIEDEAELPAPTQVIPEALPEKVVKRINELTINVAILPDVRDIKTFARCRIFRIGEDGEADG